MISAYEKKLRGDSDSEEDDPLKDDMTTPGASTHPALKGTPSKSQVIANFNSVAGTEGGFVPNMKQQIPMQHTPAGNSV
jgi:hypothetical protein